MPTSKPIRDLLGPVLLPLVGDDESFELLADRVEYRVALLQQAHGRPFSWSPACESLRAIWRIGGDGWPYEVDFTANADPPVWVDGLGLDDEAALRELQASLKAAALESKIW